MTLLPTATTPAAEEPASAPEEPSVVWQVKEPEAGVVETLCVALNLPPLLCRVLANRGVTDPEEARIFLDPQISDLHDPHCLPDVDRAVERLARALEKKERIFVHGDYDADGVTSAALCLRALTILEADVVGYVPRRTDGYDLQKTGVDKAKEAGASLIFTADCGVTAVEAVEYAKEQGIDVIVTDHHRPGPVLPPAVAVVNPYIDGCDAPFKELCGAGVAFKVLDALFAKVRPDLRDGFRLNFVDLVALGTVADVTTLRGENRIFVTHGLRALAASKKTGIKALLVSFNITENSTLDAESISWKFGPRLNAAGRMEDADTAYRLLITRDPCEAEQLAVQLAALHALSSETIKNVSSEAIADALSEENAGRRVLVLARDRWGKGVVGAAASRVVERCRRPVILLSYDERTNSYHGSGRSAGSFNLHDALHQCEELLARWGGHSASVGVSLSADNLEAFRKKLEELAAEVIEEEPGPPVLEIDAEIDGRDCILPVVEEMAKIGPFGRDNPEPVFATRGAMVLEARRVGKDGNTLNMRVRLPGLTREVKCFRFNSGDWADALRPGTRVDIAYTPKINEWRGTVNVELALKDLRPAQG